MKNQLKKVTKTLAKEIAAKFFGRTVKLVEDVDPTRRRVFYGDGYVFDDGLVRLVVFPYFGGQSEGFVYPNNKYPYGQVCINSDCTSEFLYIDGKFETQNILTEEHDAFKNALNHICEFFEDAIDETKLNTGFASDDKYIVKNKAILSQILTILKVVEKKYL